MKKKGFFLIEAIFSVFITLMIVLILQNLVKNLRCSQKIDHRSDEIAFAYVQFDRFLNEKKTITYALPEESNSSQAVFVKEKDDEKTVYHLEKYRQMVRVTTIHTGHMPLILNVRAADFLTKDRLIKIVVEERDKRKSELYFQLDPKPKENRKIDEKKKKQRQRTS